MIMSAKKKRNRVRYRERSGAQRTISVKAIQRSELRAQGREP